MEPQIGDSRKSEIKSKKKILVVEDEPSISQLQSELLSLTPFNHKITIAETGQMAMDLVQEKDYDLISLDYRLPGNYNGVDIYKTVRKQNTKIPILFVSGNIECVEATQIMLKNDELLGVLSKPCGNVEYTTAINDLLVKAGH